MLRSIDHAGDTQWSKLAVFLGDVDTLERFGFISFSAQLIDCFHAAHICIPDNAVNSRRFTAFIL
ncbi:hypothetical protein PLEI_3822 [Photobacterium leiognathi lrivu.4.1]|uniref:Uncharacterized protein n=1 Tax=Photobacterium leiognathi lrivu.4.1 TaxID=1248232 RepID=V5F7N3_PHOLE|nr:hypothetical protein PLEI_3822 [Photobacterium leiognathi lrivu.4.1]